MKKIRLFSLAEQIGFEDFKQLNMNALVLREEVRMMCSADRCERYGRNWSCPPACGDLSALRKEIASYSCGILVQSVGLLRDSFDYEAMKATETLHKKRFFDLVRQVRLLYKDCLPLAAGSCTFCRKCTYPDRPCRYPDKRFISMEAYGLWVSDVCKRSDLPYQHGENTITYTSALLLKES